MSGYVKERRRPSLAVYEVTFLDWSVTISSSVSLHASIPTPPCLSRSQQLGSLRSVARGAEMGGRAGNQGQRVQILKHVCTCKDERNNFSVCLWKTRKDFAKPGEWICSVGCFLTFDLSGQKILLTKKTKIYVYSRVFFLNKHDDNLWCDNSPECIEKHFHLQGVHFTSKVLVFSSSHDFKINTALHWCDHNQWESTSKGNPDGGC